MDFSEKTPFQKTPFSEPETNASLYRKKRFSNICSWNVQVYDQPAQNHVQAYDLPTQNPAKKEFFSKQQSLSSWFGSIFSVQPYDLPPFSNFIVFFVLFLSRLFV